MQAPLQAKNDSDAAKTDSARTVAQKRVLTDNRLEAVAQRKLAEMMNNSPRVLQQRALSDTIHDSPQMVAQRHEINALFGSAVKPQGDGAMPAEASLEQREEKTNKTGLPNQLKSGIESLSGMSMDHVTVHYNSDKPAQLQADAYAQGNEIHLATGQERHLPHEAWHVVQQAQGRVKPTLQMASGMAINDDGALEREADVIGRKAVAQRAGMNVMGKKQALPPNMTPSPLGAGVAQRQIYKSGKAYPTTWKKILPDMHGDADAILARVRGRIGQPVDEGKLKEVWNRVAKSKKQFDIDADADALANEIATGYERSMRSRGQFLERSEQAQSLVSPMLGAHTSLSFVPSARNPMVVDSEMQDVSFDMEEPGNKGAERASTHAATVILSHFGGGEEAQSSMRRDGHGMSASTNLNAINDQMRGELMLAHHLKTMAAQVLEARGIGSMGRRAAMDDVVVRHALKLYERISRYLASDAPVQVPSNVVENLDGQHAEIRIERMPDWDLSSHHAPTGTKYPCMGCYLYFLGQRIEVGHWMGPMWVTNAALSTQLSALLKQGVKMGKFPRGDVERIGKELLSAYDGRPSTSHMGRGHTKSGESTFDRRADSDSEYDDDEYEGLQKRLAARHEGRPMSPQWLGMSSGWEPQSPPASSSSLMRDQGKAPETPRERFARGEAPMSEEEGHALLRSQGLVPREFVPPREPPRRQIDVFQVNGTRYAANDPRIRAGGECLWDTLRHYGFSNEHLEQAAGTTGLTVDQHVLHNRVWPLIQALNALRDAPVQLVLDVFSIEGTARGQTRRGNAGLVLYIGLMFDPQAQGHYMPRWS